MNRVTLSIIEIVNDTNDSPQACENSDVMVITLNFLGRKK